MVVAQGVKEAEVTELDSLLLTKNLLRIAIFNISYIRGLFPEKYFNDKAVPALDMKIKKLMPVDAESRRLIDWMEKGVHDALQKKYLKTLLFCVCEATAGPVIEEYSFSFSYPNPDGQEVSMNVNRSGSKKGGTFQQNSTNEISSSQMRSSACKMIRTLVQLMRTLDKMPEERSIVMKLLYYDNTPADYEPPFFRGCTEEEAHNPWTKNPLKMEVGNVNSKHVILTLKVKSVLDPCEDENDNHDNTSLDGHSVDGDSDSDSGTEISMPDEDQYIVAPAVSLADEQQNPDNSPMVDEDDTQDPEADEQRLTSVRDWIKSCHLKTINFTDVLSHFPDISVVIIEEILEKLATEGVVSKSGEDSYCINKEKDDYEFLAVKEDSAAPYNGKYMKGEDHMYMKALYHALPMDYITVAKLQSKLGDAKATTVRKLIDKMAQDGFVESKSLGRLGRRVIHSDLTSKKLMEVQKTLNMDAMDVDVNANNTEYEPNENSHKDLSTYGAVRSIGSDLTRTGRSSRSEMSKRVANGNSTPMSMAKPTASRESCAAGPENGRTEQCDQQDTIMCTNPSQGRFKKTSMVRDPILQFIKRQRIESSQRSVVNPLF